MNEQVSCKHNRKILGLAIERRIKTGNTVQTTSKVAESIPKETTFDLVKIKKEKDKTTAVIIINQTNTKSCKLSKFLLVQEEKFWNPKFCQVAIL